MSELQDRIAGLDDKQAIHCVNLIASSLVDRSKSIPQTSDELSAVLKQSGEALPREVETLRDAELDGRRGGDAARDLLDVLAQAPDGAEIVGAALNAPPDETADFGLLTGPAIMIVAWLAVTGDIRVKIGGFEFQKAGISAKDQVAMGKQLLSALAKYVLG